MFGIGEVIMSCKYCLLGIPIITMERNLQSFTKNVGET